jgi:hypothetical protein
MGNVHPWRFMECALSERPASTSVPNHVYGFTSPCRPGSAGQVDRSRPRLSAAFWGQSPMNSRLARWPPVYARQISGCNERCSLNAATSPQYLGRSLGLSRSSCFLLRALAFADKRNDRICAPARELLSAPTEIWHQHDCHKNLLLEPSFGSRNSPIRTMAKITISHLNVLSIRA